MKRVKGDGARVIRISRNECKGPEGKTLEWSKIATFDVSIVDESTRSKPDLSSAAGQNVLEWIRLVDPMGPAGSAKN